MKWVKVLVVTLSVMFALLFVFVATGAATTTVGFAGSVFTLICAYAAIDASFWVIRNPLNSVARKLLDMNKELGALAVLIPMFIFVGSAVGVVVFGWSSLFPGSFNNSGDLSLLAASLRHGFAASLALGILAALRLPVRFGSLAEVLKRPDSSNDQSR